MVGIQYFKNSQINIQSKCYTLYFNSVLAHIYLILGSTILQEPWSPIRCMSVLLCYLPFAFTSHYPHLLAIIPSIPEPNYANYIYRAVNWSDGSMSADELQ